MQTIINWINHGLLLYMIGVYSYTIYNVCIHYKSTDQSISSILKNEKCNSCVFNSMTRMCLTVFLYEWIRNDAFSMRVVLLLIGGIYGVLMFDHTRAVHYLFCFAVFISILVFMIYHTMKWNSPWLYTSTLLEIVLAIATVSNNTEILRNEIYLLANFAAFYLYLHVISI
jgi:hypothetical protein